MNIFELNEKEMKEVLEKKMNSVTPEELLEELIECGLEIKQEVPLKIEAEYEINLEQVSYDCISTWRNIKTTGWTNIKNKLTGKDEKNINNLPFVA